MNGLNRPHELGGYWPIFALLLAMLLVGCSDAAPSPGFGSSGSSGSAGSVATTGGANAGSSSAGSAGSSGAGATSGVGASSGSGAAALGGASGISGAGGAGAGAGGSSEAIAGAMQAPSGPSAGCNLDPPADLGSNKNTLELLSVPSCGSGPITPHCVAPSFSLGGANYVKNQQWDYNNRNLGIRLPTNYDPTKPYPVIIAGGGCSTGPDGIGGGYSAGDAGGDAIRVGLSKVGDCFADGGVGGKTGHGCAVDAGHLGDCVDTPEVPYVNAVLDYVEARLCVDRARIFIGGYSSGAWEAPTVSCALANRIHGMSSVAGGLRVHRPLCTGPTAAYMIVGGADRDNPIGPLLDNQADPGSGLSVGEVNATIANLDTHGSAPMRDELLARNGCQGTATAPFDAAYPACVQYSGCPKAFPVVWCLLPGQGHIQTNYQNINYGPGAWALFSKIVP